jgi:hypothetical protein
VTTPGEKKSEARKKIRRAGKNPESPKKKSFFREKIFF